MRPQNGGSDHQPGARSAPTVDDPSAGQQLRERDDDGDSRRRPVPHQVRLARPGAGRRAADLHARRPQRRAFERHRRAASATPCPPARSSTRRRRRRAPARRPAAPSRARSARSPTGPNASVDIKVRPQTPGTTPTPRASPPTRRTRARRTTPRRRDTTVDPAADLSLTKTDSPDPALEGEQLTYTLTVHNAGPQSATGVVLTDTLPGGVTFDSATPSQGSPAPSRAARSPATSGRSPTTPSATVEIKVTPQGPGTLDNQASVTSDLADPDTADRTRERADHGRPGGRPVADQVRRPRPGAGGPAAHLHAHRRQLRAADAPPACSSPTTCRARSPSTPPRRRRAAARTGSGTVTCALGTLADTASATVEIKVTPQEGGTITNQASVSSDLRDPTSPDNAASAADDREPGRRPRADQDRLARPGAGRRAAHLHALGPQRRPVERGRDAADRHAARGRDVRFRDAGAGQLLRVERHRRLRARHASRTARPSTSTIKVRPQSPGTITNQAGVVSLALDADTADNNASAETTVDPAADLSLTKSDSPDPVLVGGTLTYTLTVT